MFLAGNHLEISTMSFRCYVSEITALTEDRFPFVVVECLKGEILHFLRGMYLAKFPIKIKSEDLQQCVTYFTLAQW